MELRIDRKWIIPSAVGVVSFGVGAATGYFICAMRFKKTMDEAQQIVEDLKRFAMVQEEETVQEEMVFEVVEPIPFEAEKIYFNHQQESQVMLSVFPEEAEDDWDYEVELKARALNPNKPYVIHKDEFDDNEDGFSQSSLTYYEGDDILCDEHDVPIYNPHTVVGHVMDFGRGSGDPNIFFVRNPRLEAEYEIIRDPGHYAIEVLGQEMEQPVEQKRVPKFRDE